MNRAYKGLLNLMQQQGAAHNPAPPMFGTVVRSNAFKTPVKVRLNGGDFSVAGILAGVAAEDGDTVLVVRMDDGYCVLGKVVAV